MFVLRPKRFHIQFPKFGANLAIIILSLIRARRRRRWLLNHQSDWFPLRAERYHRSSSLISSKCSASLHVPLSPSSYSSVSGLSNHLLLSSNFRGIFLSYLLRARISRDYVPITYVMNLVSSLSSIHQPFYSPNRSFQNYHLCLRGEISLFKSFLLTSQPAHLAQPASPVTFIQ